MTTKNQLMASSGLSKQRFDRLWKRIAELKKDSTHMAGVALVEFSQDVDASMKALDISEKVLAQRAKMSIQKLKAILEPPLKAGTSVVDLSRVAKALGKEVSIRLRDF